MKIKAKTKGIIKKVSLALAGVIAISAIGVGVAKLVEYTKEDLKTISPSFSAGNLGTDGKYVNDESTLYTKEAFQCDGLQIKLDFDNEIEYQIYFYDDLDNFVESTEVLSSAYSDPVHDGYARIVIMPTNDEDGKIGITERLTYPDQMTIKVAKEQNIEYYQVFNKRLFITYGLNNLVFSYGDIVAEGSSYIFTTSSSRVVTSHNLLAVNGGETVSCSFDVGDYRLILIVYQFKNIDGNLTFVSRKQSDVGSSSVVLSDAIDCVVFSCHIYDSSSSSVIPIEEDELELFSSYFSIS